MVIFCHRMKFNIAKFRQGCVAQSLGDLRVFIIKFRSFCFENYNKQEVTVFIMKKETCAYLNAKSQHLDLAVNGGHQNHLSNNLVNQGVALYE